MLLVYSGQSFRRFNLTIREIYFSGFQSLLIILVSGLFIGMVLGMQGYETLQRYGSSEALGVLVALSLTRELGPVVAALLFGALEAGGFDGWYELEIFATETYPDSLLKLDPVELVRRGKAGFLGAWEARHP